jgi:hypothetical protein
VKRPKFAGHERGLLVLLASLMPRWRDAILVVKPETVLRWHRGGHADELGSQDSLPLGLARSPCPRPQNDETGSRLVAKSRFIFFSCAGLQLDFPNPENDVEFGGWVPFEGVIAVGCG